MYEDTELSIHHSFWYFLSPTRWTTRSLAIAFIAFYLILTPIYFFIGFRPAGATAVAEASEAVAASNISASHITIENIGLDAPIIDIPLEDGHLATPDYEVGRFISTSGATFLFAHSTTAFQRLREASFSDHILYDNHTYHITDITTKKVEDISMSDLLDESGDTLILMTCAGSLRAGNYTHRLIITATR